MTLPLASSPTAYWYATRGAGTAALILLTASVVVGIVDFSRWRPASGSRFLVDGVHRTVSMLAVAMVAVHVVTTVADGFAPVTLLDAVVPFASPYRPLWLGLGTVAFDLLLAVTVTSLLRGRIGHRAWRAVHWAAYACWPLALVHGLGTGTDAPVGWSLLIAAACGLAVLVAVAWRIGVAFPAEDGRRALAGAVIATGLIALIFWTVAGPLASNWAGRAGTPTSLLASVGAAPTPPRTGAARPVAAPALNIPFTSQVVGSIRQRPVSSGVVLDVRGALRGGAHGTFEIQIGGQPVGTGGVAMTASRVALGPPGEPSLYRGRLTSLHGTHLSANVASSQSSARFEVDLVRGAGNSITGTASATGLGGAS
jgi:DMSO/TMAO reductase YedYZ heme-binding membrane subunit